MANTCLETKGGKAFWGFMGTALVIDLLFTGWFVGAHGNYIPREEKRSMRAEIMGEFNPPTLFTFQKQISPPNQTQINIHCNGSYMTKEEIHRGWNYYQEANSLLQRNSLLRVSLRPELERDVFPNTNNTFLKTARCGLECALKEAPIIEEEISCNLQYQ